MEQNEMKAKRKRATKEEVIARLEKQNAEYEAKIAANKKRIEELKNPKPTLRDLAKQMKAKNISVEDLMKMINHTAN